MAAAKTKTADSKGRVILGDRFKNRTVIIEERGDEVVVKLARVIPESEAWLYDNPAALASVRKGLEDATLGKTSKGPDMRKARMIADAIPDDE